jgi:cytochrome c-type biogenesis protein
MSNVSESQFSDSQRPADSLPPSQRRWPRWSLLVLLALGGALAVFAQEWFLQTPFNQALQEWTYALGDWYKTLQGPGTNPVMLLGMSFLGGLLSSISPCVLSLLPVNLTYIGTREIQSRRAALAKASSFVLGAAMVLSALGLFSSLGAFVLVQYPGYFQVLVGGGIICMGLSLLGWLKLPLPQLLNQRAGFGVAGPFGVGLTFALVSSPCSSPILFSVLAAAAATQSTWLSCIAMLCYALGYTAIIFFASLFAGLAKQTRWLLQHSERITQVSSLLLLLMGVGYLVNGLRWVIGSFTAAA